MRRTRSRSVELRGEQVPRVRHAPSVRASAWEDAVDLAAAYGLVADDWQETVLEGALGERSDGRWAASRVGLCVPRQNGKNGILEMRELFGLVVLGEKILHTAHEIKTARKAFLRLMSFFDNPREYPDLAALVAPNGIRKANSQEAIVLRSGASVEFIARTQSSGRGFTADVLILDEAQQLSDETFAALLPTISAAPLGNPQTWFTGTPPGPKVNGEVFTRARLAGLDGTDRRLCWLEWSCEGSPDLDDKAEWARANPALGVRLNLDTVADERADMDAATFARERLGIWGSTASNQIFGDHWARLVDQDSQIADRVAYAIDTTPDRGRTAIVAAGKRADGLMHVEVIESRSGVAWATRRIADIVTRTPGRVALDPASSAGSLIPALMDAGIDLVLMKVGDVKRAYGLFHDLVTEVHDPADREKRGGLRHGDQPELNEAVEGAKTRMVGDAPLLARKHTDVDISPLVAATLAVWVAMQDDEDAEFVSAYTEDSGLLVI